MKRMLLAVCCVGALLGAAFASGASLTMDDLGLLVKDKCAACHGLAKTCANLGRDEAWWGTTVDRMVKRGADVEQSQAEQVAIYLAAPDEDFLKACGK